MGAVARFDVRFAGSSVRRSRRKRRGRILGLQARAELRGLSKTIAEWRAGQVETVQSRMGVVPESHDRIMSTPVAPYCGPTALLTLPTGSGIHGHDHVLHT